jgi:amino acid adenylation domain-containing protein
MTNKLFPLTLTQNDIYLDQLRHKHSPLYNVGGYIRFGEIDLVRLADAHRRLVCKYDIFGLRISATQDGVFQSICHTRTTSLTALDFSKEEHPVEAAEAWQSSLFETAFDIVDAELFRAYLVKITDDHYRYLGLAHHIMMDGWGFSNWAQLLGQLYNDPSSTPDTRSTWLEVALDDELYIASEKYLSDKEYWIGHLKKIAPLLFSPRYQNGFTGAVKIPSRRRIIEISRTELNDLKSLAYNLDVGVSHYFLAVLALYFANTSGQDRLVFGLPFHNRRGHSQKRMLGVFTSISPLCIDTSNREQTFGELAQHISKQQKASFRHQRYPLGHIIRDSGELCAHRSLYDVGFNYLKLSGELSFGGKDASLVYVSHNHEATPLMVTVCEYGDFGVVQLQLDYNLAYINDLDISLLADRFSFLLRSIRGASHTRIADLEILPDHEVRELLEGFGDCRSLDEISNRCIHHLFEEQVRHTPNAIAVTAEDGVLTYGELNRRANVVAHYLIRLGIEPESLVGICMKRTVDVLVGVLGILKAGGAYVPLDPSYPTERIRSILENSGIQVVLTHRHLSEFNALSTLRLVLIDELLEAAFKQSSNPDSKQLGLAPSNLAYVIYTSGSTGKPKGVEMCHFNTVALLDWVRTVYTPEELGKVLASTSLNFDLSVFEMFAPLSVGGQCVVVNDALDLLVQHVDVSLINTVPSAIKVLIEQDAVPRDVRVINLAGEPLPMHVVNDLLSAHKCEKVFNLYGPSEATTYSTYALFNEVLTDAPNIGRAIAGTRLYILSPSRALTPTGAIGELHIAGEGLARGYLNSPDLTAEKFISHPLSVIEGERWYRTGDLVRYGANGDLEYVGRADDQVKIRGFRVELGEIQKQFEQLDGVKTAVVLVRERSSLDKYLAAYVERSQRTTGADTGLSDQMWADELERALRTQLPAYMIPASISVLDEMPLTPNGKIDKKALLALPDEVISRHEYVAPQTRTEIRVVDLWADLLGVDRKQVGATTSLFDLGGHSLLLVRLANDIRLKLGVNLSVRALFDVINLRDLAGRIDSELTLQLIDEKMNSVPILSEGCL